MPVLVTVRNTGTHTAQNILSRFEMHYLTEDRRSDAPLWFGHAESTNRPLIDEKMMSDPPLILTMRHPMDAWRSWRKRGKMPGREFQAQWQLLFSLKEQYEDSFWLPMDISSRGMFLDDIEDRVGPVNRDWTPKGVYQSDLKGEAGMTEDEAVQFLRQLPFEQFGYRIHGNSSRDP